MFSSISLTDDTVKNGPPVKPLDRIKLFSPDEWEKFVEEWLSTLKSKYLKVDRLGGSGDKGRDVVATINQSGDWVNYQCKHYDHALYPSDIWLEIGKLVYYTKIGDYTYPSKYYFVAPQGIGTSVYDLLNNPNTMKRKILEKWDKNCKNRITRNGSVHLDKSLKEYIDKLDFTIFSYVKPLELIEQFKKTNNYTAWFGNGLPERPKNNEPPKEPSERETTYIRKLLDAYSDFKCFKVSSLLDLKDQELIEHFMDSRIEFYCAESLKRFSRDTLPSGVFERLQNEIYNGIKDELRRKHTDGYEKVLSVTKTSKLIQIDSHPLKSCLSINDRSGICHQLANDRENVKWVKDE